MKTVLMVVLFSTLAWAGSGPVTRTPKVIDSKGHTVGIVNAGVGGPNVSVVFKVPTGGVCGIAGERCRFQPSRYADIS
jgi:hypothetical protein